MSVSGISSSTAPVYTPPVQQQAKAPEKAAPKTDTVTISKQAPQLASDGDTQAQEMRESGAEKASELVRGKA